MAQTRADRFVVYGTSMVPTLLITLFWGVVGLGFLYLVVCTIAK